MAHSDVYLAVDLGASSGRVLAGFLDQGRIGLEEVHRFPNALSWSGAACTGICSVFGNRSKRDFLRRPPNTVAEFRALGSIPGVSTMFCSIATTIGSVQPFVIAMRGPRDPGQSFLDPLKERDLRREWTPVHGVQFRLPIAIHAIGELSIARCGFPFFDGPRFFPLDALRGQKQ